MRVTCVESISGERGLAKLQFWFPSLLVPTVFTISVLPSDSELVDRNDLLDSFHGALRDGRFCNALAWFPSVEFPLRSAVIGSPRRARNSTIRPTVSAVDKFYGRIVINRLFLTGLCSECRVRRVPLVFFFFSIMFFCFFFWYLLAIILCPIVLAYCRICQSFGRKRV